jgi:hypothetical protein
MAFTQVLYNGITLPKQWPPRYEQPTTRREMPVPYLTNKPVVIPINVGRQLFVDDFLIKETDLKAVFSIHPIIMLGTLCWNRIRNGKQTPQGALYAAPFSDGLWYG